MTALRRQCFDAYEPPARPSLRYLSTDFHLCFCGIAFRKWNIFLSHVCMHIDNPNGWCFYHKCHRDAEKVVEESWLYRNLCIEAGDRSARLTFAPVTHIDVLDAFSNFDDPNVVGVFCLVAIAGSPALHDEFANYGVSFSFFGIPSARRCVIVRHTLIYIFVVLRLGNEICFCRMCACI